MYTGIIGPDPIFMSNNRNITFFRVGDDTDDRTLTSCTLKSVAGQAGQLTFTLPAGNVIYGTEYLNKLKYWVRLLRDDKIIFSGRIIDATLTFDGSVKIICEGDKARLNDVIVRAGVYQGDPLSFFEKMRDAAELQSLSFNIGELSVLPETAAIYREYDLHGTLLSRLDDLVDSYGGYIDLTLDENENFVLNWVSSYTDIGNQHIDFGDNLLDITIEESAQDIITHLIPQGAMIEDDEGGYTGERVSIKSVNGQLDYINANGPYIDKYGHIWGTAVWDDVTLPENLLVKATEYLNSVLAPKLSISVSAIDLHNCGYEIEAFDVCNTVIVNSAPHGLAGEEFEILQITLNILNIASSKLIISSQKKGYISDQLKQINKTIQREWTNRNVAMNKTTIKKIENLSNDLDTVITELRSQITQDGDNITLLLEKEEQIRDELTTLSSKLTANSEELELWFGENGHVSSWFHFSNDGYFTIGKGDSVIRSRQDNDSYEYIDESDNVLLRISTSGLSARNVETNQVKIYTGTPDASSDKWAMRLGNAVNGKHNLDIMWIGG